MTESTLWTKPHVRLLYPGFLAPLRRAVVQVETRCDYRVNITQGFRTYKRQDAIYAQGRTLPGKVVTHAKGGQSFHNFGVAADGATFGKDPYLENSEDGHAFWKLWGECAQREGLEWGGNWPANKLDIPHVQMTCGMSHQEMHGLYIQGGIAAVWESLDRRRGVEPRSEWGGILRELELAIS